MQQDYQITCKKNSFIDKFTTDIKIFNMIGYWEKDKFGASLFLLTDSRSQAENNIKNGHDFY